MVNRGASAEYVGQDPSMYIGEPEISATITEGLFGVVDTHQVQGCCMEIVYVDAVFN